MRIKAKRIINDSTILRNVSYKKEYNGNIYYLKDLIIKLGDVHYKVRFQNEICYTLLKIKEVYN